MGVEAPIQVDLSQDLEAQKLWDGLTGEEQTRFNEYFNAEKEGILYLTQNELTTLKSILAEDSSASHDTDFDEFIQEQKTEGLSTSDILGNNDILSERDIDKLDEISQKVLFGTDGVFEGMNISETAQDHISVSLTLSIIEQIANKTDITPEYIQELFSGEGELSQELKNKLDGLTQMVSGFVNMEDDLDANSLDIAGNGERNFIFMKTEQGKDFFNKIFSDELDTDDMESYIEEQNIGENITLPQGMTNILAEIQIGANEDIQSIQDTLKTAAENMTDEERAAIVEAAETSGKELTGFAKILHDFFKNFIDIFKGLVPDSDDDGKNSENNPDEATEITENKDFDTSLPENFPNRANIIEVFERNPDLEAQVHTIIDKMSPDETMQQSFDNLFGTHNAYTRFLEELTTAGDFPALQDDTLNPAQKMLAVLEEYSLYRNNIAHEIVGDRTEWKQWINERKLSNWNSDNVE